MSQVISCYFINIITQEYAYELFLSDIKGDVSFDSVLLCLSINDVIGDRLPDEMI